MENENKSQMFSKLKDVYCKKIILDIKEGNSVCPEGFNQYNIDFWPGTRDGCKKGNEYIVANGCDKNSQTIYPISAKPYTQWNGSILCTKYPSESDIYQYSLIEPNSNCKYGLKNCGYFDSQKRNILCVPRELTCPINWLDFSSKSAIISEEFPIRTVSFGHKYIHFSTDNTRNGIIFNGFKVKDNQPCMDTYFSNEIYKMNPLDYYYTRNKCLNSINGKFTDDSYTLVDSINYSDLLRQNNISLSFYSDEEMLNYNHMTNLYSHFGFIGIDLTTPREFNFSSIESICQHSAILEEKFDFVKSYDWLVTVIMQIFMLSSNIYNLVYHNQINTMKRDLTDAAFVNSFLHVFYCIFLFNLSSNTNLIRNSYSTLSKFIFTLNEDYSLMSSFIEFHTIIVIYCTFFPLEILTTVVNIYGLIKIESYEFSLPPPIRLNQIQENDALLLGL
jgi:hypothetical protein